MNGVRTMIKIDKLVIPTNRFDITDTFEGGASYYFNGWGLEEHIWKYSSTGKYCYANRYGDDMEIDEHYIRHLANIIDTTGEMFMIKYTDDEQEQAYKIQATGDCRFDYEIVPDYRIQNADVKWVPPGFYPIADEERKMVLKEMGFKVCNFVKGIPAERTVYGILKTDFDLSDTKKDMVALHNYTKDVPEFEYGASFNDFRDVLTDVIYCPLGNGENSGYYIAGLQFDLVKHEWSLVDIDNSNEVILRKPYECGGLEDAICGIVAEAEKKLKETVVNERLAKECDNARKKQERE